GDEGGADLAEARAEVGVGDEAAVRPEDAEHGLELCGADRDGMRLAGRGGQSVEVETAAVLEVLAVRVGELALDRLAGQQLGELEPVVVRRDERLLGRARGRQEQPGGERAPQERDPGRWHGPCYTLRVAAARAGRGRQRGRGAGTKVGRRGRQGASRVEEGRLLRAARSPEAAGVELGVALAHEPEAAAREVEELAHLL